MGISNADGFIYSPSVDGDDSVWSHNGLVLSEGVQAPGFPAGTEGTFNSRPTMIPGGAAYWIAGFNVGGQTGGGNRYAPVQEQDQPAFELLTRKAVGPDDEELALNPRSRSAKLRVARRTDAPAGDIDGAKIGMPMLRAQRGK